MLIMGYASYSSFQRVRYHFSPLYRQGYTTFISTPEVELEDEDATVEIPSWAGMELTYLRGWSNASLARMLTRQ